VTIALQLLFGSLVLLICTAIHISFLISAVGIMTRLSKNFPVPHRNKHWGGLVVIAVGAVLVAHTMQVWIWAAAFVAQSALSSFEDAIYFSLVTYTTLGYGDVTVTEDHRLFAAMAAVTGLLNFGLSTAFLVALLSRLLPDPNKPTD